MKRKAIIKEITVAEEFEALLINEKRRRTIGWDIDDEVEYIMETRINQEGERELNTA